jgi:hypothetical protein
MKLALVQTAFNKMMLVVSENTTVDIFNGVIKGLTITAMTVVGAGGELVDFNPVTGDFIIYETKKNDAVLANGNICEITFDIEQDQYGTYPITIEQIVGATNTATGETIGDVSADLRITFSQADLVGTISRLLKKTITGGIDVDGDGKITIKDVAKIIINM